MYTIDKPYADPGMQRKLEWVACMLDASKASAAKIGCSPEAIVAQAAQETGWGRSAIGKLEAAEYKVSYRGLRAKAYPPIGDQLDALWKGGQEQTAMKALIEKVKADYPKPA